MSRTNDFKVAENFKLYEFECNHCGQAKLDPELVEKLQRLRDYFGRPIKINSGFRCSVHNKAVGGSPKSQHVEGKASDIVINGVSPEKVADVADRIGFDGIGIYNTFTHLDVRGSKARWDYR